MPTTTDRLVEFITEASSDTFPAELERAAVPPILDTIGVVLAGRADAAGAGVLRYAASLTGVPLTEGPWLGWHPGVPADMAALVTSTLAHAMDFDDVLPGAGHPSSVVLSAILAVDADTPLTGEQLLAAYVVGVEVMGAVSRAVGHRHYKAGWHTTSTIGSLAATATAAKVLALDPGQVAMALSIAVSTAAGLQRNFGSLTKPVHSGFAARNGVTSALLARAGITGAPDAFDGPRGFFDVYGVGGSRPEAVRELGSRFSLLDPGMSLKKYACCFEVYRPIEAVLEIQAQQAIEPAELARLTCTVPPGTTGPLIDHPPTTGTEAKFSIEHALAAAFVDREITMATFTDSAVFRADLRDLVDRMTVVEDVRVRPEDPEGVNSSASSGGFVEVVVETTDGRTFTGTVAKAIGTPAKPLSSDDVRQKVLDCAELGGVPAARAASCVDELTDLATVKDVRRTLARLGGREIS